MVSKQFRKSLFSLVGRRGRKLHHRVNWTKIKYFPSVVAFIILSVLPQNSAATSSQNSVLTVEFPGLTGVHTEIYVTDGKKGIASGEKVKQLDWRSNSAVIEVPAGEYDLRVRKGEAIYVVDNVDCSSDTCFVDGLVANLTMKFPGLSSLHTSVQVSDGEDGTVTGKEVTHSNWRSNETEITVLRQVYDLKIEKGATTQIVDNVDCTSGSCTVDGLAATMTLKFPGMSGVHTSVRLPDSQEGEASGTEIDHTNWKNDETIITVLPQIYDLEIRKGSSTHIIDNVDCRSGSCTVDEIAAVMTVKFPGLSRVFTTVVLPDGIAGNATGQEITHTSWKNNETSIAVFPQVYDLKVEKGSAVQIVDNVDCTSGTCIVDELAATMTVNFPGLSSVHTTVLLPDGVEGEASGNQITSSNWKEDQAIIPVFPQVYDLKLQKGSSIHVLDNVDCTTGECTVDGIAATMTVNFSGLTSVHTAVLQADGRVGEAAGEQVTFSAWKTDSTVITVFPQVYDLKIQKGPATLIVDDVDCTSGACDTGELAATMAVEFPGLSSVHTTIFVPNGAEGSVSGDEVTHANWKNDEATIKVLAQAYDVRIQKESAITIVDNVDCSSGECRVDELTAILTVEFPGMSGVHTEVKLPDGVDGTASGGKIAHANWKNQGTAIPLLRKVYDVSVTHDTTTVFDNVDCSSENCSIVIQGNAQIRLIDDDNDVPLPGLVLRAYEKLPDGTLVSGPKRTTNDSGKANFTLEGLGAGKVYVIRVDNPFGNEKKYYSPFLTDEGPLDFRITRSGEYPLDLIDPEVTIRSPIDRHGVSVKGFRMSGYAADDNAIESVIVTVNDPLKGLSSLVADYVEADNSWSTMINSTMISENSDITLTAMAVDRAHNKSTESITVLGIVDSTGPEINITSHENNQNVPITGFLLSGTVTDETSVKSLRATLEDPIKGKTIDNQEVSFAVESGNWTIVILSESFSEGNTLTIHLTATDFDDNVGAVTIQLKSVAVDNLDRHLINRITFGATPQLLKEVQGLGAEAFLSQQLNTDSVDDSEFTARIGDFLPTTVEELKVYSLLHMIYSKRQLQEVMTWFWDNHFNTYIGKPENQVSFELAENQGFRQNALGNFRDLLEISAKSPAMLYYLDSVKNTASDANENYSREVLELHTMGVDGGYTSSDIEAGAEIFTGWGVRNGEFFFDDTEHNFAGQSFLGVDIASGGVEQGEILLDIVTNHPSTAEFICTKLIALFVSDNPPASLVQRAADTFQATLNDDDQIARVVHQILTSPEFTEHYHGKIKTPLEFVVGFVRNLSAETNGYDLPFALNAMGMALFENPVPTGWSEIGSDWMNSNLLLQRIKWVNHMSLYSQVGDDTFIQPLDFFRSNGYETAEGIAGFLMNSMLGSDFTSQEWDISLEILNDGATFRLTDADANEKLRELVGTVLSFPGYQYQ